MALRYLAERVVSSNGNNRYRLTRKARDHDVTDPPDRCNLPREKAVLVLNDEDCFTPVVTINVTIAGWRILTPGIQVEGNLNTFRTLNHRVLLRDGTVYYRGTHPAEAHRQFARIRHEGKRGLWFINDELNEEN